MCDCRSGLMPRLCGVAGDRKATLCARLRVWVHEVLAWTEAELTALGDLVKVSKSYDVLCLVLDQKGSVDCTMCRLVL